MTFDSDFFGMNMVCRIIYQHQNSRAFQHELLIVRYAEVQLTSGLTISIESSISDDEWNRIMERCYELVPKFDSQGKTSFVSDQFMKIIRFRNKSDAMRFKISLDVT
jgi:hypothetical protein